VKSPKHFGTLRFCGYRCPLKTEYHKGLVSKHGLTGTPLYRIYYNMKRRCTDPEDRQFKDYGGRGISMCPRWDDPELFVKDMGPAYQDGLSLDRIDVDGDYCPGNCRWVPLPQQQWNKRNSRFTEEQYEAIAAAGHISQTILQRMRRGETFDQALSYPKRAYCSKDEVTLYRSHGLSTATVTRRLRAGWPKHKAFTTPSLIPRTHHEKTTPRSLRDLPQHCTQSPH
jgi:hypothetical protein